MQNMTQAPFPGWVPLETCRYLQHTEAGRPIRQLARKAGCHPSTILRQVRRVEILRDDPLIDEVLTYLAGRYKKATAKPRPEDKPTAASRSLRSGFEREAASVLTLLSRGGAVLAAAEGMEMAVVVREGQETDGHKVAVSRPLAGALALTGWIACSRKGRISRYAITAAGRAALNRIIADQENRARARLEGGFAEVQTPFEAPDAGEAGGLGRKSRYSGAETPLEMLARLLDKDGKSFLTQPMVRAGRRLREDFELAQISSHLVQEEMYFAQGSHPMRSTSHQAAAAAHQRMTEALQKLGAGLSDIALRCCCHLEGLETAERNLGWPARSGKVVLRIALQHLADFYGETCPQQEEMIG
ncbi:helix-turn-helix domain-containing protein [Leisingera sp. S132]|uniref:helix-turn-helix domain-containing protein n=1 Tax=Leisingera sp. S132 TaxID=2867016 RepID=UPI0021A7C8FB|nr:helix-turn-helix domain-containing protein [Leisingera sp. S132]UWQ80866.1 helix-turn-helix domain-containing protein [Leisingera sp. S132]